MMNNHNDAEASNPTGGRVYMGYHNGLMHAGAEAAA